MEVEWMDGRLATRTHRAVSGAAAIVMLAVLHWVVGGPAPRVAGAAQDVPVDPDRRLETSGTRPATDRPNIVFILADDLGGGDLGCFGNDAIRTPSLDRLAREGTRFTQFYVPAPVCSPTRAGIMTGRFPSELAIHNAISGNPRANEERGNVNWLDPLEPTITGMLRSAGYAVGHFGKWHLGAVDGAPTPGAYGIDDHLTVNSTGPQLPQRQPGNSYFRANSTAHMVDEVIRFVEENRNVPFFVNVWTLIPHAKLNPTDEQLAVYENLAPPGVPFVGAWQVYYASITAMDAEIGRLVARIDELGLGENTLIIFTSDNGPAHMYARATCHSGVGSSGPFRGRKTSLYEGGVRMPLIVRWPGRVAENEVDNSSVIAGVDFLPTFCALAGIDPPYSGFGLPDPDHLPIDVLPAPPLDGEDVSETLLGSPRARRKSIMWEWRFGPASLEAVDRSPMLAIRSGPWKLLLNPDGSRAELYDVVTDPMEVDNLANVETEIVAQLSAELLAWQATLPAGPVADNAGSNEYPWP
ncbi:MAG: sulfatase family protein, partial [Planctomycetota bacterium]|jgi:N-acetylgalactosamine-6-sulfatase